MQLYFVLVSFLAQVGVISFTLSVCSLFRDYVSDAETWTRRAASGLLFGLTAAVLMNMPGELVPGFRFDLRIVPIAIAGMFSGPLGSIIAAILATFARLQIGGAGSMIGITGIWLAVAIGLVGSSFMRKGLDRAPHLIAFSALNGGLAVLVLMMLPAQVRQTITNGNDHIVLLALNFLATLMAASYVKLDQQRRMNARLNYLHRQVVAALPDALNVKDLQGRFVIANPATAALMGAHDPSEIIGRTDYDFYSNEEAGVFHQQEQSFIADPRPIVLEQSFTRDDQVIWLSTVKAPYFDERAHLKGIVSHTTDVTVKRTLQRELTAAQSLLQTAIDEMADGLAVFDKEGRLVMWNRHYVELFPYIDERTCRGRTLSEILTAGVLRGQITPPFDVSPSEWVDEEVERSASATDSELRLSDGRWVAKTTTGRSDGGWVTLYADISDRKAAILKLERLANRDGLTDVANRRFFDVELDAALQDATSGRPVSLILVDVDHFKAFNDSYGHPAGDHVLRSVAGALQSACRDVHDVVARYGGEEFAAILPGASTETARDVAERMLAAVRSLNIHHGASSKGRVTVSIGFATSDPRHHPNGNQLLKDCDSALYAAKAGGRDIAHTVLADVVC